MKKIISGLMLLFAALTLTSCVEMTSETELTFEKLPQAVITDKVEGSLYDQPILINIKDGKNNMTVTLKDAEKVGAVVEGAEYEGAGYHTLLVTYKDVTIAFTYLVNAKPASSVDVEWYEEGKSEFTLSTAAQLRGLAQLVNNGKAFADPSFAEKTVKLGADIDLAGYAWNPIGEGARKDPETNYHYRGTKETFHGTFDGQGYTISNMSDAGYVASKSGIYENSAKQTVYGYAYGLFGVVNAENVVIKNVKLANVQINGVSIVDGNAYYADSVAGVVGYSGNGSISISNCEVSGSIKGLDAVAGIVGRIYNDTGNLISISNCSNAADLLCTRTKDGKAAGIVGFATKNVVFSISECSNSGSRSVPVYEGTPHLNGSIYNRKWSSVLTYNGTPMFKADSFDGKPDTTNEGDIPLDK